MRIAISLSCLVSCYSLPFARAETTEVKKLVAQIPELDPKAYNSDPDELKSMVRNDLRKQLFDANKRSSANWYKIKTREQWEEFSQARIAALRKSLGQFPEPPKKLNVRVTGGLQGDGYRVENVVFESRSGFWVTANLYSPAKPTNSMPGIILCHSHHRPKEQGELKNAKIGNYGAENNQYRNRRHHDY